MCGIAGIWNRDGAPVHNVQMAGMTDALIHRGPDGVGVYVGPNGIALGHRRLKVIDLSEAAAQPIWLPDKSLCMVYNGEIHNYLELAAELRSAGARLRTDNDTEILLWSYRTWGEECFERLNGMWAAAFWEPARRRLLLSRDRFGIKPLYYSQLAARIAFASEPKAILAAFPDERRADVDRVRGFVTNQIQDPDGGTGTFFGNIHSLPAGELLCIRGDEMTRRKYWSFRPGREESRRDCAEEFLELLRDAVKIRLRSDVPVGVLLSGGLDSSTVARLAVSGVSRPLECISLRYDDKQIDESSYASMVASDPRYYNLHWVTPSSNGFMNTISAVVWHHDAPTPMRGRYPQWHVLQEASKHVTVVLGGQGADELLGGYDRFALPFLRDRLNPGLIQSRARWRIAGELIQLGSISKGVHRVLPFQIKALVRGWIGRQIRGPATAKRLGAGAATAGLPTYERPYRSHLNNALWNELRYSGLPELLHSEDALSMAFSLESRLPFLDHRIVEFCFGVAFDEKIKDGWSKHLLRRATVGVLPEAVRLRRKKLGFPGDYAGWLGGLGEDTGLNIVRDLMSERRTLERDWVDARRVHENLGRSRRLANRWVSRHTEQAWRMLTAELWARQFLDNDHSSRPRVTARVLAAPRAVVSTDAVALPGSSG